MTTVKKQGFTLIELLVVIAIIAILSAIGLVALNGAREKARDAQRRSDIAQIRTALTLYYDDNGSTYPGITGVDADETLNVPDNSDDSAGAGAVGTTLSVGGALTSNYLAQALTGPTADGTAHDHYFYLTNEESTTPLDATEYVVYTMLEAAGGANYYGINTEGTVTDIANAETAAPVCDNTAASVCSFDNN